MSMLRTNNSSMDDVVAPSYGNGGSLPWDDAMAACFVLQLATLFGTILFSWTGIGRSKCDGNGARVAHMIHSCAAAALLSTALFLLVPKSLELIATRVLDDTTSQVHRTDSHSSRKEPSSFMVATWFLPLLLASGIAIPILLHRYSPTPAFDEDEDSKDCETPDEKESLELLSNEASGECDFLLLVDGSDEDQMIANEENDDVNPIFKILVGDCFHNFTDGVFLGAGFLLCGKEIGYTLLITAMHHQLGPKLSDFGMLRDSCGLGVFQALVLNVLGGFCIHLGCIVMLSQKLDEPLLGFILAIAAGVYMVVGFTRFIPRIRTVKSFPEAFEFLICIAVGAAPLALTLADHVYCGL